MLKKIVSDQKQETHSTCHHQKDRQTSCEQKLNDSSHTLNELDFSELLKLQEILFDTPEAQQAKIQMIKDELLMDRYQINAAHIAKKLQEFSSEISEEEEVNPIAWLVDTII